MKTWICSTLTSILGPTQGSARLFAYVKKQGYDISLKDLNQDAYFTLLSRPYLEQACEKLAFVAETMKRNKFLRESMGAIVLNSSNKSMRQILAKGLLKNGDLGAFKRMPGVFTNPLLKLVGSKIKEDNLVYALLSQKDYVISEIESARRVLYNEFFNLPPDEFVKQFSTLLCGKALIDATYFPALLDFGLGFHGTAFAPRVGDILRSLNDERHNFLIPYFRARLVPELRSEAPAIVGISVTHASEFVPAFTLANIIKSENPETHICLGGATLTEMSYRLAGNHSLWDYFDSLIKGPGEEAFSELIEKIEAGQKLSAVPNLIYKENGRIKESEKSWDFDLNEACTPEYVSVLPRSILPLETSSGCYWGKCIFCYYPKEGKSDLKTESSAPRIRNLELVLQDMVNLRDRYNPIYIGFTDSSLSPRRLEQIAEFNLHNETKVNFSAFFRFEKDFKSKSFCEKLARGGFLGGQAGLESGCQRINNIINKGVNLEDVRTIIRNFDDIGILVHLYSIVGLPTESKADARMTYNFIKRWHHKLSLGWQIYSMGLLENGPLAARAGQYGITASPLPADYLIQAMRYQVSDGLSQNASAGLAILFTENLKRYLHPLNNLMDAESLKVFLLARKSYLSNSRISPRSSPYPSEGEGTRTTAAGPARPEGWRGDS